MFKSLTAGASALAMIVLPVAASAAPAATSAQSLSVARAASPSARGSKLSGLGIGPVAAGVIGAAILVGAVILIADHEDDDADSN